MDNAEYVDKSLHQYCTMKYCVILYCFRNTGHLIVSYRQPGPYVIKNFPCSIQLSMKFFPLIYVKMPTIVDILICMSGKNNIQVLTEPKKAEFLDIFFILMSI